ncbi:membrane-bound lytic murein transglycosylase MltF [Shewanella sp.]|nr:membrane-bound lytic murein transglycosylase MltF [Shewanella sp.]
MLKNIYLICYCVLLLTACQKASVEAEQVTVKEKKELSVGTLFGSQIYFSSEQGDTGYDYEMAEKFAKNINLKLNMHTFANIDQLYQALDSGKIDIIAAGLTDTLSRRAQFRLGPPLYRVDQVLVYKKGTPAPRNMNNLAGAITVVSHSAFVETLSALKKTHPKLVWSEETDKDAEELLAMVDRGDLHYTVVNSTSLDINRRFMPELRAGPVLKPKQSVVWLLPLNNSDQLMSQLLAFWHIEKRSGTLAHLTEKYFGHVRRFDYVDTRAFIRAIDSKLPKYQATFKKYAGDLDWRKLAATAYQESHWNAHARSPTGVRGLMMLTLPTAKQVGIKNRLDPYQSIRGGAKYLNKILKRLPKSIPESQRMWFALASYNIGFGHVEDARKLAQSMGLNPSAWRDMKKVLPLLQQRKYYKKTRYGYARGKEAVHYVDSIRRYYDTLVWMDSQNILLELEKKTPHTLGKPKAVLKKASSQ